jgi:hypothetical protein
MSASALRAGAGSSRAENSGLAAKGGTVMTTRAIPNPDHQHRFSLDPKVLRLIIVAGVTLLSLASWLIPDLGRVLTEVSGLLMR